MQCHTGREEPKRIYADVVGHRQGLGVDMPVLEPLGSFVQTYATEAA